VRGGTPACSTAAPEGHGGAGRQLTRLDFLVVDELNYLPFAQAGGQLLFHLVSQLYERASIVVTTDLPSARGRPSSATRR
jgi:DNA replication protein DnaC